MIKQLILSLTALILVAGLVGCDSRDKPATSPNQIQDTTAQPQTGQLPAAQTDADNLTAQTLCPVMGGKINQDIFVDYNGKRIYFCCPGCQDTFKENPQEYLQKMADEGIELQAAPTS